MSINKIPFTIVVPFRDTEKERGFAFKSLKSAVKVSPDEILVGIDSPPKPDFKDFIRDVFFRLGYSKYKIVEIENTNDWNMPLAKIIWNCYNIATYDRIYSYDIDSEIRKEMMKGLPLIGTDNVAVLSFTKKLRTSNLTEFIRNMMYRIRVHQSAHVFSGNYWIYRPYFFDMVDIEKYKKIRNGVDTFLVDTLDNHPKYVLVTRKEKGVNSFDLQNEDYDWRQFQVGIWMYANNDLPMHVANKKINLKNIKRLTINGLIALLIIRILKKPNMFVRVKSLLYGYPFLVKGFDWARKNPDSEAVKMAKTMSINEWNYFGSKYLPKMNWERKGTGF